MRLLAYRREGARNIPGLDRFVKKNNNLSSGVKGIEGFLWGEAVDTYKLKKERASRRHLFQ